MELKIRNSNIEIRNKSQNRMPQIANIQQYEQKGYDLEGRTFQFAKDVRAFVRACPKKLELMEDFRQVLRTSGSVGANYIEANEALGKKDFMMRIKICKKEAKESRYWLQIIEVPEEFCEEKKSLIQEAHELMCIFGAILRMSQ